METLTSGFSEPLPLVVAVTGHRDLVDDETDEIRERVRALFSELAQNFPSRRLRLLSPLAEGADQLVAEVATELDIDLVVPLPMDETDYLKDFSSEAYVAKFESLKARASDVFVLQPASGATIDPEENNWTEGERAYARLGIFLAAHCHVLLALWDGKQNNKPGGTGHVVRFHHDDVLPGFASKTITTHNSVTLAFRKQNRFDLSSISWRYFSPNRVGGLNWNVPLWKSAVS